VKVARQQYLVYVGTFFDEAIVQERGLPSRNAAGSNRMVRLSEALRSSGVRVLMLSPGISMRVRWTGHLAMPYRLRRMGQVPVLFSAALGLPVFGMLCEGWSLIATLCSLARRRELRAVMIYDFPPSFLLLALFLRIFMRRVPIIHNIEDVSEFRWSDWRPKSQVRPFRQLLASISMNIIVRLAAGVLVPTQRFFSAIPVGKARLVISGCMPDVRVEKKKRDTTNTRLRVLYSGSIELAHGIGKLVGALGIIDKDPAMAEKFSVDICGSGIDAAWVQEQIAKLQNVLVNYHGFVSDQNYRQLLLEADICLSLQDPHGRYGETNTPSKVYEYIGNGKLIIATNVGDIAQIPDNVLTLCDPLTEDNLVRILGDIAGAPERIATQGAAAANYAREHFSYAVTGRQMSNFLAKL